MKNKKSNNESTLIIVGIFAIVAILIIMMLPSQKYAKAYNFCKDRLKTADCSCFAKCADNGNSYSICLNNCSAFHQYLNQDSYQVEFRYNYY